ncbi:MAG: response regulator [Pseudomonadota bacterium]
MSKFKALIVDDAGLIRDLIRKALRTSFPNWQIQEEINGLKARQLLKNQNFDLILCDWEMPEMSGEELLTWFRQEAKSTTPFIMVTSRGDKDHVVKAIQAGVSNYLVKPFNNQQLLEKVSVTLKKAGVNLETHRKHQRENTNNSTMNALVGNSVQNSNGPKKPQKHSTAHTAGSIDVLTGGGTSKAPSSTKKKVAKKAAAGVCQLRLSSGLELRCVTKNITLQKVIALSKTDDGIPQLLEQAVIDVELSSDNSVARINGFIAAMEATTPTMTPDSLQLTIIIVDNDADKIEQLSKYIAEVRR